MATLLLLSFAFLEKPIDWHKALEGYQLLFPHLPSLTSSDLLTLCLECASKCSLCETLLPHSTFNHIWMQRVQTVGSIFKCENFNGVIYRELSCWEYPSLSPSFPPRIPLKWELGKGRGRVENDFKKEEEIHVSGEKQEDFKKYVKNYGEFWNM